MKKYLYALLLTSGAMFGMAGPTAQEWAAKIKQMPGRIGNVQVHRIVKQGDKTLVAAIEPKSGMVVIARFTKDKEPGSWVGEDKGFGIMGSGAWKETYEMLTGKTTGDYPNVKINSVKILPDEKIIISISANNKAYDLKLDKTGLK